MTLKIFVRDAETGSRIEVEATPTNTVEDLIVSAAQYWKKDPGAYVLRQGKRILQGDARISELSLVDADVLELLPDPEGGASEGGP
ncbi:MAG: ubiquitin-like domain-containing protein [Methanobacteriota archaeon]